MTYYIYILYSPSADKFYVGHSNDVARRLEEHNNPIRNTFTSKYLPWEMACYFEVSEDRGGAMKAEQHIKKQKSKGFIKQLIASEYFRKLMLEQLQKQ